MSRQKFRLASVVFLFLGAAGGAGNVAAVENDYYLGIGAGTATLDIDAASRDAEADLRGAGMTSPKVTFDQQSTGYKVLGGYQAHKNFAVELYYADLGAYNFTFSKTTPAGTGSGSTKVSAFGVDVLGILPITESLSALGRVGPYRRDSKGNFASAGASSTLTSRLSTNIKYGVGLEWAAMTAVGLRFEYEYYDDPGQSISMLSLGLVSHF